MDMNFKEVKPNKFYEKVGQLFTVSSIKKHKETIDKKDIIKIFRENLSLFGFIEIENSEVKYFIER